MREYTRDTRQTALNKHEEKNDCVGPIRVVLSHSHETLVHWGQKDSHGAAVVDDPILPLVVGDALSFCPQLLQRSARLLIRDDLDDSQPSATTGLRLHFRVLHGGWPTGAVPRSVVDPLAVASQPADTTPFAAQAKMPSGDDARHIA